MDWQAKSDEEKNSAWHLSITRSGSVLLNSGSRMYSVIVEMFGMGTGRAMSLISSHMRGNSPANGSLVWNFLVLPQWEHVQTIKEVLVHFPAKCIPPHHLWQNGVFTFFHVFIFILKAGPVSGLALFLENLHPVLDVLSVLQLFGIACNITTECNISIAYNVFIRCQMTLFYTLLHPQL